MYYGIYITDSMDIEYSKEVIEYETADEVWGYANGIALRDTIFEIANDSMETEDFFEEIYPRIFELPNNRAVEEFNRFGISTAEDVFFEI